MNDLKVLGTISRSHGLKGAFKVNTLTADIPALKKDEPVFIQLQGGPVPFFVEEFQVLSHSKAMFKLNGVDGIEKAEQLVGNEILLEKDQFQSPDEEADSELLGFEVIDEAFGSVGVMCGVMDTPQHPILEVEAGDKTALIPWVEEIVLEVDSEKRQIRIKAPEGLIDLYLNG